MPRVREEVTIPGWAWCENGLCDGNVQKRVQVVRTEIEHTMLDSGGDSNQVEKSFFYHRFAKDRDKTCQVCGGTRACGEQERPVYPGSNWDPDGLRKLIQAGVTAAKGGDGQSKELEALREQLAKLEAQVAEQAKSSTGGDG